MFSKRNKNTKSSKSTSSNSSERYLKMLREAVERNASIGIVRLGRSGVDPMAQGRLLEWNDGELVIEKLQIIGRETDFNSTTRVEAFFMFNGHMITFESEITYIDTPERLNEQKIVSAVKLKDPIQIREGDRRAAYRVSLPVSWGDVEVKLWFLDRVRKGNSAPSSMNFSTNNTRYTNLLAAIREESLFPEPSDDPDAPEPPPIDWNEIMERVMTTETPHAVARLVDLTPNGLGILMYNVSAMQLDRFERLVLSFQLPEEPEPTNYVVEMRQSKDLQGSTCRVGTLLVHPDARDMHAPERKVLERLAMRIQREQLKNRSA